MKHNAIFIEGLPGSGKTTFASRLKTYYESIGQKAVVYYEGDLNPIDLAWCAMLNKEEYDNVLKTYPNLREDIIKQTRRLNNTYIVAYTRVRLEEKDVSFYREMEEKEIYKSNDFETFKTVHLDMWNAFQYHYKKDTVYIFESIYLQNHINELILKYNLKQKQMTFYFQDLMHQIQALKPVVFYIEQQDVDGTIERIIEERRTDKPEIYADWIDLVMTYLESQPYAKEKGYIGKNGGIQYLKDRQIIETSILRYIDVYKHIFQLNGDYDRIFEEMKTISL